MQGTIDSLHAMVAIAARQGVSQAHIQLSPESLGSIRIELQSTDEGLVARVVADHPETAQTLQQNAGELRRSLESTGQTLLRLDIEASGQRGLPTRNPDQKGADTGGYQPSEDDQATATQPVDVPAAGAVESSGTLVNVLA
jgi:flagellar hook-length control protein FliK